jgi:acetyl esterase/lipase
MVQLSDSHCAVSARNWWRWPVGALMGISIAGCSPASPLNLLARRDGIEVSSSIPYGRGPRQTLDVYRPRSARSAPVMVFFYGGSWQAGGKEIYPFLATALAQSGYVTVVPDYRVYPEVIFPGFLEDGAQAVGWVRQNAKTFGGNPARMILLGHSAGAHIAAMLALDPRWLGALGLDPRRDIAGLIGISGPYDFLPIRDPTLRLIFGGADRALTQPITFVRGGEPPTLLLTGDSDRTVDPGNSARLAAKLRAAGDDVREIIYPGVSHVTIIGAFAPALHFIAPVLTDVDRFSTHLSERAVSGAAEKMMQP